MKLLVMILAFLFMIPEAQSQDFDRRQTINGFIGDEGLNAYGAGGEFLDEAQKISIHLAYVEEKLRAVLPTGLSEAQSANRLKLLNLLREYRMKGVFPSNHDYLEERRPCFIDRDGKICAVGFLIEKTAGREVAEWINEKHQYDFLMDMNEALIGDWARDNGLTLEECAMIQPSYGWPSQPTTVQQSIGKGYGVSSGIVGGFNVGVTAAGLSGRFGNIKWLSHAGLITGAAQLTMGLTHLRKDEIHYPINGNPVTHSYKAQNHLSYANMAMGTATILTSALNLYINNKINDKRNAFGLYTAPGLNRSMTLGVSFSRNL